MSEDDSWTTWVKVIIYIILPVFLPPIAEDILHYFGYNSSWISWLADTVESCLTAPVRYWHLFFVGVLVVSSRYAWSYFEIGKTSRKPTNDLKDTDPDPPKNIVEKKVKAKNVLWKGVIADGSLESVEGPYCPECETTELTTDMNLSSVRGEPNHVMDAKCPDSDCRFRTGFDSIEFEDEARKEIQGRFERGDLDPLN